jgi:integrase
MVRDARDIDGLITGDPFAALKWPDKEVARREAFIKEECDRIIDYFRSNPPFYYPFIFTLFWTRMRPSECIALRVGDIDLGMDNVDHKIPQPWGRELAQNAQQPADNQTFTPMLSRFFRARGSSG